MAESFRGDEQFNFKVFKILIICVCVSLYVTSCTTSTYQAPVQSRTPPPSSKLNHHVVAAGETLYSIAWRYGIDYKELARYNGISRRYTIFPGQRLVLKPTKMPTATNPSTKKKRRVIKKKRSKSQTATTERKPPQNPKKPVFRWQWPVKGKLLQRFSSANGLNKGIDIVAKLGEPVSSAAPGSVVYAGKGLRGYGNLLIIKHDEKYLSAYAHNRKLLVREGEKVREGQKIAEVGLSGTNVSKLHFEIRRNGKPVDPLKYLPKR